MEYLKICEVAKKWGLSERGAAGGTLGGLVSGSGGTSAGAILAKFLKHPIKNFLTDLGETLIMDFTNWYFQFVIEGVIDSYA